MADTTRRPETPSHLKTRECGGAPLPSIGTSRPRSSDPLSGQARCRAATYHHSRLCSSSSSIIMPASVASLDSIASEDSWDFERELALQQEWEESLEELQKLLTFVLLPFFGKWFGRRTSHWGKYKPCQLLTVMSNARSLLQLSPGTLDSDSASRSF